MLRSACPILPSRDFDATVAFYAAIGFGVSLRLDGQYLIVQRDGAELHFFHHPSHVPQDSDHGAYIRTDDVDAVSDGIAAAGMPSEDGYPRFQPAEDTPWGVREATVWDPDGNLLRIGGEG